MNEPGAPVSGAPSPAARRRDDAGNLWTEAEVEAALFALIVELHGADATITRKTRFEEDLGWDSFFRLGLVKKVKRTLHESLSHGVVLAEITTADRLVKYVWSLMDPV